MSYTTTKGVRQVHRRHLGGRNMRGPTTGHKSSIDEQRVNWGMGLTRFAGGRLIGRTKISREAKKTKV